MTRCRHCGSTALCADCGQIICTRSGRYVSAETDLTYCAKSPSGAHRLVLASSLVNGPLVTSVRTAR